MVNLEKRSKYRAFCWFVTQVSMLFPRLRAFLHKLYIRSASSVCLVYRARRPAQRKKKEKKDPDARLSAKQRRKIKSKAIITSSDEDSDSDVDKLKISEDIERYETFSFQLRFNVVTLEVPELKALE